MDIEDSENRLETMQPFFDAQKTLKASYFEAARQEGEEQGNLYHKQPMQRYRRHIRQLLLFAKEMQRHVTSHHRPDPEVVRMTVEVFREKILSPDKWDRMENYDVLEDELLDAMALLMEQVLAMRDYNNTSLNDDIKDRMNKKSSKFGLWPEDSAQDKTK
ncbi:hypothetical protein PG984_011819 [Apiospora sp. TS-2023a]